MGFQLIESNGVLNTPQFQGLNSLFGFMVVGEEGVVDSLKTVFIPNGLESIEGDYNIPYENIRIFGNINLESVLGGQNLQTVGRAFFRQNENLIDLSAFDQVEEIFSLSISSCQPEVFNSFKGLRHAESIFLSNEGSSLAAQGCSGYMNEVVFRVGEYSDGLFISESNSTFYEWTTYYSGLHLAVSDVGNVVFSGNLKKTTNLKIETKNVAELSGFATLDSIYSAEGFNNLEIINPSYASLPEFSSLTHIEGDLFIDLDTIPSELVNLQGLENLETINGNLWVKGNVHDFEQPFQSLDGLDALITVGKTVRLKGLTSLEDISGLQNATNIYQINLDRLPVLELDFEFENLLFLERLVMKNTGATMVPYLNNATFPKVIYMKDNLDLLNTDGFSNISELNNFSSISNLSLMSITMAEGVVCNEGLTLTMNPALDNCGESPTICSLVNTAADVEIGENGLNCNTTQEVLNACNGTDVGLNENGSEIELEAYFSASHKVVLESDLRGLVHFQLIDIQGKVLVSGSIHLNNESGIIQVPSVRSGIYTLILRQDNKAWARKMVKL